jgi:hypothetical protein
MWKQAIGLDGEIYDSQSEATVADWFLVNNIEYEPHKRLPKPSRSISDFYLPEYDLWVEYDGLMEVRTDDRLDKKRKFYEKQGLKFLIITRDNWQTDLLEQIELGE